MRWLLLTVSTLAIAHCRPQNDRSEAQDIPVEIEKQNLIEIHPQPKQLVKGNQERSVDERTRQIYEKIAEVNKKQGLTPRKRRPDYFHFPYSYSRSQSKQGDFDDLRFSTNSFANPILEYLLRQGGSSDSPSSIKVSTVISNGQNNAKFEENEDEVPAGHFIKRKIVHQQTLITPILPNAYQAYPPNMPPLSPPYFANFQNVPLRGTTLVNNNFQDTETSSDKLEASKNNTLTNLEKVTVENIKNIVLNSQTPLQQIIPVHLNAYGQDMLSYPPSFQTTYLNPALGNYAGGYNNYQLYGPFVVPNLEQQATTRQQLTWPFAQFFPIVIRDPMQQMMNAITSMVEFGSSSGSSGSGSSNAGCRHSENVGESDKVSRIDRKLKNNLNTLSYDIKNEDTAPEITIYGTSDNLQENVTSLDIEDLEIKAYKALPTKNILDFKMLRTETRQAKLNSDVSTKINIFNVTKDVKESKENKESKESKSSRKEVVRGSSKLTKAAEEDNSQKRFTLLPRPTPISKPIVQQQWLPSRDKPIIDDDKEDTMEDEKAEDVSVSHNGNKKLFSKDNTGSGIFIHKLKVRKGGVAIAGPGGIATAGSGGTAIVGPGGVAYTHPDSLAIAGSGTKVVAVDPSINLGDLISGNNTRKDGNTPRVGKVVAVGPVVYYNRGDNL